MWGISVLFVGAAGVLLTACASAPQPPQSVAPIGHSARSSSVLWQLLATTTSVPDRFSIEAELATRGETSSGGDYLGRHTSALVDVSTYHRLASTSGDRDCADFASSAEAQKFFLSKGGPYSDPHGLDRDGDGMACEFGAWLVANAKRYRAEPVSTFVSSPRQASSGQCFVGPRGGTYTITASGRKNYGGC